MGYLRGLHLDAFSAYPCRTCYSAMLLARQLIHHRSVHPVLALAAPFKYPTPTTDRDRTVHDVLNPARVALMGEQPNPWNLLQLQDATSRHRQPNLPVDVDSWGDQPVIPGVVLSVERWPFHTVHRSQARSTLLDLSVSQLATLCLCTNARFPTVEVTLGRLRYFLGGDCPSQTAHQTMSLPAYGLGLELSIKKSGIPRVAPRS